MKKCIAGPLKRILSCLLAFVLLAGSVSMPVHAAGKNRKTVRVGYFKTAFNLIDENGRRSGYAYDYLQEIAGQVGWDYEYIDGNWSELMQKLEKGEIDILADVSYTKEREEIFNYSQLSMGSERYYIYSTGDSPYRHIGNASSLDGLRVGVSEYSIECESLIRWTEEKNITVEIIKFSGDQAIADAVNEGKIDIFVSTDGFCALDNVEALFQIGESDIYFGINKSRTDLKEDIDKAMMELSVCNPYLELELNTKYITKGISHTLLKDEIDWLNEKKVINVGYVDDYMAFCGRDPETGETSGVLKYFLEKSKELITNAELNFATKAYKNTEEALAALKKGEVDCVFPIEMTKYDAEQDGFLVSQVLASSSMIILYKYNTFKAANNNILAVCKGDSNYKSIVVSNFTNWKIEEYETKDQCFEAIAIGAADCALISNYRIYNVQDYITKYTLQTLVSGSDMKFSFATNREDIELYSILNRLITLVPKSDINLVLSDYSARERKVSLGEVVKQNFLAVTIIVALIILVILIALLFAIRYGMLFKKQKDELQEALDNYKQADYDRRTDFLTGLRNRQDMFELLQDSLSGKREQIAAMYMMDIDNFKTFNDNFGHVEGDSCLQKIGAALKEYGDNNHMSFYRYGGEEILGILFNDSTDVERHAAEIVKMIYDLDIKRDDVSFGRVTISLGYTNDNRRYEKMIDKADTAMYKAKSKGKNGYVSFEKLMKED